MKKNPSARNRSCDRSPVRSGNRPRLVELRGIERSQSATGSAAASIALGRLEGLADGNLRGEPLDGTSKENQEPGNPGGSKRSIWQVVVGILMIAIGVPGLVLPLIPGIALIVGGSVLILGRDHHLVQRGRQWLIERGWLEPSDDDSGQNNDSGQHHE